MARSVMSRASWPSQSIVQVIFSPLRMGADSHGPGSSPRERMAAR
jgi:hypothetical protein